MAYYFFTDNRILGWAFRKLFFEVKIVTTFCAYSFCFQNQIDIEQFNHSVTVKFISVNLGATALWSEKVFQCSLIVIIC